MRTRPRRSLPAGTVASARNVGLVVAHEALGACGFAVAVRPRAALLRPLLVHGVDVRYVPEHLELAVHSVLASKQKPGCELVPWTHTLETDHRLVLLPQGLEHARHPGDGPHFLAHAVSDRGVVLVRRSPLALLNLGRQPRGHVDRLVLLCGQRGPVVLKDRGRQLGQVPVGVTTLAGGRLEDEVEHLRDLLDHEGDAPRENIHKVGQVVRVGHAVELQDVEGAVVKLEDSALVVVDIAVVGGREYGDHRREARAGIRLVHLVTLQLSFMRSNDRQQGVLLQEGRGAVEAVEVRAASHLVGHEGRGVLPRLDGLVLGLQRIGPEEVAKKALAWRLLEPVHAVDGLHVGKLRREPAVDDEELPVDRCC
mmetsp:Transcript_99811/g.316835  ORF Transcript_99811/g.316835 Transcript_99811/m.316835 type:complete len:367 (-) Transcript_99811:660-1760(-)